MSGWSMPPKLQLQSSRLYRFESSLMDNDTGVIRNAFVEIDDVLIHQPHTPGRRRLPDRLHSGDPWRRYKVSLPSWKI